MTDFPMPQELEELKAFKKPNCLTIYMPLLDPSEPGLNDPNRIKLKNLVREAKTVLHGKGLSKQDIKKILYPIEDLLKSNALWPRQCESVVLFAHRDFFRYYHIPDHTVPDLLTVGQGFDLKPLLKAMRANRSYFVLALGHKDVRLYEGDHFKLTPVQLKDFPADMVQTLRLDENPKWRETHSIAQGNVGRGSEASHGQYNVAQVDKIRLEEFFRNIDHRLHFYLASKHKPLILAGANYLLPIYRKVNTYSYLWPSSIRGNVKEYQPRDIIEKAWSLLTSRSRVSMGR